MAQGVESTVSYEDLALIEEEFEDVDTEISELFTILSRCERRI